MFTVALGVSSILLTKSLVYSSGFESEDVEATLLIVSYITDLSSGNSKLLILGFVKSFCSCFTKSLLATLELSKAGFSSLGCILGNKTSLGVICS